jgi:phosphoglycolate phosphatase
VSPPLPYRLLVFDWDGTLRDSIATIVGCASAALLESELPADEDAIRGSIGLGLDSAVLRWCPQADASERERVREAYGRLWRESWHHNADLFEGVPALLRELARRGHWLAIATGKSRPGLDRDLAHGQAATIAALFLAIRTADTSPPKPSPAMVLEILEELGASAADCLVIGDSEHDLEMARAAGCDALGVCTGVLGLEELERLGARAVLPDICHLGAWLANQAAR